MVSGSTDILWGGQLRTLTFDAVDHCLCMPIEVLENGTTATFDLLCRGVSEFRFRNEIPEPWSYAEVTEVHACQAKSGQVILKLVLWSDDCEFTCRCDDVEVRSHS